MDFGTTPDGQPIKLYTLTNGKVTAKVTNFGAILVALEVPDRRGKAEDIVLGYDTFEGYLHDKPFFGATVGRFANRIAKATFQIDGKTYHVPANDGANSLHGGTVGFNKKVWAAENVTDSSVRFTLTSPDGDQGFPGNLKVAVTYTVTPTNALRIDYQATTDKTTPVNLTHHTYFNLSGPASGNILDTELTLAADSYTPVGADLIPTGQVAPVQGTPLDFTRATPIGARIKELPGQPQGYDHNYVVRNGGNAKAEPVLAARASDPKSGRVMDVFTTEPGIQLYTGNFLDGSITGRGGVKYNQYQAFCLETQHFPDSVNQPKFASPILEPGQTYTQTTLYQFSTR